MRALFIVVSLCIASMAWGQAEVAQKVPAKSEKKADKDERGTEKAPLIVKTLSPPKSKEEAEREAKEGEEKRALERATLDVNNATLEVNKSQLQTNVWQMWFNGLLVITSAIAAAITWRAANAARDAADYAGKGATPLLMPYILGGNLHPIEPVPVPVAHLARLLLSFDNYGSTPATTRQFKGRLFLRTADDFPGNLNFTDWEPINYNVVVPGDFRGKDLATGALDFTQPVVFEPNELAELLSDADTGTFRRFALIGHVVYDDVFGYRHTRRFCIKLRVLLSSPIVTKAKGVRGNFKVEMKGNPRVVDIFQVAQGPAGYNTVTTEKIPNPDPLAA